MIESMPKRTRQNTRSTGTLDDLPRCCKPWLAFSFLAGRLHPLGDPSVHLCAFAKPRLADQPRLAIWNTGHAVLVQPRHVCNGRIQPGRSWGITFSGRRLHTAACFETCGGSCGISWWQLGPRTCLMQRCCRPSGSGAPLRAYKRNKATTASKVSTHAGQVVWFLAAAESQRLCLLSVLVPDLHSSSNAVTPQRPHQDRGMCARLCVTAVSAQGERSARRMSCGIRESARG